MLGKKINHPKKSKIMKRIFILALLTVSFQFALATDYYVSTSGNDASGNGSSTSPWRTLKFAVTKVAANQGHIIRLSAGTFVENGQFNVPPGVSVEGAGIDQTYIKAASSFYFNPSDPGFATDKFLMTLNSGSATNGNQSLKNFTLDGDGKRLHGGIYIKYRNNVLVENIKVQNTNFCAMWLWDVKYSTVRRVTLINGSWGNTGWAAGDLMLANLENVDISGLTVDENQGYGIKALGSGGNTIQGLKLHDSRISVIPNGKWNNGSAPNISVELWSVRLVGCEIYNNYMDNHLSLVSTIGVPSVPSSVRVYNNTFDLKTRAGGHGYGIELSMSDAEIDHNWFHGGSYGIAHWSGDYMGNWKIHHNTFYGLNSGYPGDIVRAQKSGLHNVKVYNNSVEFAGTTTIHFIGLHGGSSDNVELKNNLVINSNTGYTYGTNQMVFMENGATIRGLQVMNNLLDKMPLGAVSGATYSGNKLVGAGVTKTGSRPNPYYAPAAGSPLIDAGLNLFSFLGTACDIGAFESGSSAPSVAVSSVSVTPATVTLNAGATTQLTKAISPSNATNQTVSWTSSNMSVATVSSAGLVTAGTVSGTATITCTTADGNKTATSAITVVAPIPVLTVSVTSPSPSINVGSTSQLSVVIGPANATNQSVTWSSSNVGVASVDANGLVRGIAPGTAVITARTVDGGKTATASITVNATGNSYDIDDAVVGTGTNQFNYVAAASWGHATNAADPFLQKTCSFSNVSGSTVTVPFTGTKVELYTAKAAHHGIVAVSIDNGPETNVDLYSAARQNYVMVYGSAALTSGNHTIRLRVTGAKNAAATGTYAVIDYLKVYTAATTVAVTGVTVSPSSLSLSIGGSGTLSKVIAPANATNQNVVWTSSNAAVATVASTGIVNAIAAGTATITATTVDGGKIGTCAVTVNSPVVATATDLDNNTRGSAANQFNFAGAGWYHATNTADPYFQKTVSFSNIANEFVTVSFTGDKIEFYSAKASHHGIVGVSIDNGAERMVDLYSATRQSAQMVFTSGAIAQGTHTIKIRVTGTKNSAATGTYAIVDYLKLYSTSGGGGGGSSEAVAMTEESAPMQYGPNPLKSGEVLHVNLPDASGEVTLLNMSGVPQRTLQVTETAVEIPTAGLFEGIYFLQYRSEKGSEIVRIMVQ